MRLFDFELRLTPRQPTCIPSHTPDFIGEILNFKYQISNKLFVIRRFALVLSFRAQFKLKFVDLNVVRKKLSE